MDEVKLERNQQRYMPDAGKHPKEQKVLCGVCNSVMNVEFDIHGPTSYADAMANYVRHYDDYICPHQKTDWHQQVAGLFWEADHTASAVIEKMLLHEASGILSTRQSTKVINGD